MSDVPSHVIMVTSLEQTNEVLQLFSFFMLMTKDVNVDYLSWKLANESIKKKG